jgi:hypothetical protein
MVNDEFAKDIKKALSKEKIGSDLEAGTTPRRYEPAQGVQKHNERIHKESKTIDQKGMPFTFSKPSKTIKRQAKKVCTNCDHEVFVAPNCIGMICSNCKTYASVKEVEVEGSE